jgi:hypothetical protein
MKTPHCLLFLMPAVIVCLSACASPRSSARSVDCQTPPAANAVVIEEERVPAAWLDAVDVPLPDFDSVVSAEGSDFAPAPSRAPMRSGCAELDQTLAETRLVLDDVIAKAGHLAPEWHGSRLPSP